MTRIMNVMCGWQLLDGTAPDIMLVMVSFDTVSNNQAY